MRRSFKNINVFSDGPLDGNPVAVVLDADGLDTDAMLAFTRWTNLSEATFVLPPTEPSADYRVRIFTLDREMPFAGHPTLGTCHAWLDAGGIAHIDGMIVQECGAGLVNIRAHAEMLWFEAPPLLRDEPVSATDLANLCKVLGLADDDIIDAHWLDNGPGWVVLMLPSADAVLAVRAAVSDARIDVGLVGLHAPGSDAHVEIRALFSDHNGVVREDPVTGSLNAGVAQWLFRTNRAPHTYVAAQGQCLGRRGRVHLEHANEGVWVGGRTTTVIDGLVIL